MTVANIPAITIVPIDVQPLLINFSSTVLTVTPELFDR